jgi:hypothetical protein
MNYVYVPVMRVQNVAGLLLLIVAAYSYPQKPLNISTQKPGTVEIVSYIHVYGGEGIYIILVY